MDFKNLFKKINSKYALLITGILIFPAFLWNIVFDNIPLWALIMLIVGAIPFLYIFVIMIIIPVGAKIKSIFKKK